MDLPRLERFRRGTKEERLQIRIFGLVVQEREPSWVVVSQTANLLTGWGCPLGVFVTGDEGAGGQVEDQSPIHLLVEGVNWRARTTRGIRHASAMQVLN